ncbi:hypothetical protein Tco_0884769 [Tanacetum coccineum]
MVEGSENVIDDSLPPRNDEPQIPDTKLEPQSDKESPKEEKTNVEEVEVTNVVIPVNVNEEDDEITDEVYELMYVVPTGRVKVPAGRYVVPTGKDNVIVSTGRTKVIPAGRTILVLVVLCLLRVDSKVS